MGKQRTHFFFIVYIDVAKGFGELERDTEQHFLLFEIDFSFIISLVLMTCACPNTGAQVIAAQGRPKFDSRMHLELEFSSHPGKCVR